MNTAAIIIMAGIIAVAMIVLTAIVIYTNNKHRKKAEELARYQMHITSNIDKSIPEILDLIINESFADYKVKFLIPLNEEYINTEREAEIRTELVQVVSSRISNAAIDKLSLFYNPKNIAEIIADKIYIAVMNYTVEHNAEFSDGNEE